MAAPNSNLCVNNTLAQIQAPLQDRVLPQLQIFHLISLRNTCRAWRSMVDFCPLGPLLPAAKQVIPQAVLSQIYTSVDLQSAAQQQATILRTLQTGPASLQDLPKLLSHAQDCDGWSRWSPSSGHCWVAVSSWRPAASCASLVQPAPPAPPRSRGMAHPWHRVMSSPSIRPSSCRDEQARSNEKSPLTLSS